MAATDHARETPRRAMRLGAGGALVLLLALAAEGDVAVTRTNAGDSVKNSAAVQNEGGFLYSRWIGDRRVYAPPRVVEKENITFPGAPQTFSARQTFREQPGSFWGDVAGKVRERAVGRLRGSLLGVLPKPEELRAILIRYGNGEEFDMAQWREIRRRQLKAAVENAPLAFYADTEQSLARAISQTAVDRLGFVRRARVDFRTSLGDRRASGGVDAAGALRESADEVIGWQLRAYAGEGGNKGGNIGAFWRRAQWLHFVDEGLLGANIFADYEDTDDGSFWRWSIGGEMKTRLGDVNINRYFVLTDPVVLANNRRVYSRAGLDIDAALNIPGAEWAQARVGYFLWEGEFGDADIEGFKAGFDIKPGAGVVVGVEFDGESGDIGGNFAYTHNIGEPFASAQGAGVFDPRAHFFDAVRREYSQRIVNTGAGDGANFAVIVGTGLDITIRGELPGTSTANITISIAAASLSVGVNDEFAVTGSVVVETGAGAGGATIRQKGGDWNLIMSANTEVAFLSMAATLSISMGSGVFDRVNPPQPSVIAFRSVTTFPIGTRFRFGVPGGIIGSGNRVSIDLLEGGMSVAMNAMNSVTIKVAESASVLVMGDNGSVVVVGCGGDGQSVNVEGVGAICVGGGGAVDPISPPDNVSVDAGGRVLVPFGALVTVGRYSLSMVNADITLTASVETPGFSLAVSTAGSGDGRYFAFDIVIEESAATVAGAKSPRVSVWDPAGYADTRLVQFQVQVARKLQVNVNPAQVEVTQNITAANIAVVNASEGTRDYLYSVITHDTLFNLDGNIVNNNAQINNTAALTVSLEATDALGDKATVDLTVNVAPTPALALTPLGLLVVGTSDIAVAAGGIIAAGGATPLTYNIAIGDNNFAANANLPSNGGAATVNVTTGAIQIRGTSVGQTFDLYYRVQDSAPDAQQQTTLGTVLVSVSEGVALSGPILNATVTATTNGGSNTGMVLGTVMAQLRADLQVRDFNLLGGHAVLRPADDAARREVYYSGNTQTAVTARLTIRVTDTSAGGEGNPPNSAEAVFYLAIVNPANVTAGLSGDINLRYFVNEEAPVLTATASGGAGGNVFRISVGNSGARVGNDGVLLYNGRNTNALTVTVFADDNHSGTDATPAVTVTLSAIARLRAESITRPRITTGSTLSGANAVVVTVSVSGGENRAAFAYSRIGEGTQLTGADINNSGVIFAADGARIDAEEINGSTGGSRNFVYEVVDGAIVARRQTLTATAVVESIVPQPIAARVQRIGNEVITVGADAMARLRITPSGGGGAYNFAQTNAANIVTAGAQADANNAADFIVSINANAAGTASVSIVIDDEHFATEPLTLARRFVAIDNLAASYAGGANFSPLTANADIKFATINIAGGLNPGVATFAGRTGPNAADLRIEDRAADNRQFALVLGGGARNTVERTITFAVSVPAANGDAVTISGTVEVVDKVQLRGGGRITVFAEADAGDVVAEFKPVGGVPPYSDLNKLLPATFPGGFEASAADKSVTITRTNTDLTAGDEHIIAYEVSDSTDGGAVYATATATITVINALSAALDFAGGALDTGVEMTVATLSAGGGAGDYAFSANNNAVSFVEGTIAVARLNNVGTVNVDLIADDDNAAVTEPVTIGITLTALAPLTLPQVPDVTLTTGASTPGNRTLFVLGAASGGQPPYEIGSGSSGEFASIPLEAGNLPVSPLAVLDIKERSIVVRSNIRTRNDAVLEEQTHEFAVRDSSNPPRVFLAPRFNIQYILPPSVVVNVNQTVNRYRKGVSVTLATLTYSGGSGAAGLTASVLSFYQAASRATVIENEVVVWPDPAVTQRGTARAVVVAYDSANGTSPEATVTIPLYVVDTLRWTSPPTTPLTVTTQGNQSGSYFNANAALPRLLGVVGGNADNSHNLGSRTDGFNLGTQNQQFSYTGNGGRFAQDAQTVTVTVFGTDRNAADNYRQTTSLTITVAFIDPPDLTIGFDGAFNSTPLTSSDSAGIIIGTIVLGAGLNPQDPAILGNGGDFTVNNPAGLGDGTVQLLLGGANTGERVTMVTITGNDERHTNTDAVMMTIAVTVVDRIKLNGGGRVTLFAGAASTEPVAVLTAVGGMGEREYGLQTTPALPGYVSLAGGGGEPITLTYIHTHTGATVGAAATIAATVKDTNNTVSATVEVTVIGALAAAIDFAGGALTTGVDATVATISASGGVGEYTFTDDNANVNVVDGSIYVANFANAGTVNVSLIADDDNAAITEPATIGITLTALAPLAITPLEVMLTTGDTVPADGTDSGLAITASGGDGTYSYTYTGGANSPFRLGTGNNLVWTGNQLRAQTGTVVTEMLGVTDSSTPNRATMQAITLIYVNPPSVEIDNLNQTVRRYKNEVSVAVAAPLFSGGAAAASLTATVAGVEAGVTALITNNTVVVSASAGVTGGKEITIAAYDSGNNTAPSAMTVLSVHFVAPLGFDNLPSEPLTVTTQDSQGSAVEADRALPIQIDGSGGNTANRVYTPPANYTYTGGLLRYSGNTFPANPSTADVEIIVADTPAVGGYAQTATATVTVAFIDPPDVTIGFESGADFAPLTSGAAITIGALVVGGGLNAKDAEFVGDANGFSIADSDSADTGTVNLVLGVGNGTTPGTVTVTISGDDGHSNTDAATLTVTVEVVDRVKLEGAGRRYTVLAQADNAVAELFALTPVGGMPPYGNQSVVSPTSVPDGFTRSAADKTVTIGRNAVSIAAGEEHVFVQEISDASNTTLRFSATVTVINELALSVGDNQGGDAFRGDINLPGGFPFGQGFASGGAGAYTYRVEGPGIGGGRQDVRVGNDGVMVASHSSTHPAATITYTLIADDATDLTEAATALFTLTVLTAVAAEPLPVITVTTKSTPGGAGSSGGGTVPAFTIDASGGQPSFAYYLSGAQTPGALADDILYYTADSANNGVIYFNTGVQASAAAGDNVVAHNLQVRDSSAPTRNADVPGMLTIKYVNPPSVTVAANQTVSAYKTGASITVAALTYSGGESGNLTATVLGVAGDAANIMARVSGGDLILSAAAAATPETITISINAFDAGNDTAGNATAVMTIQFVAPLVFSFGAVPTEPLTLTTQDTQGSTPGGDILPLRVPAGGGNGTNTGDYNYVVTTPGFTYNNGLLRYTGNDGDKFAVSATVITVEIVARDQSETRHYRQAVTASITLEFTNPPDLSMGFVETPLVAALTTANDITIGTIALTGGLTDLRIVITGDDDDFALSLIESSPATAALILSGDSNANAEARTVAVTITGDDNHTDTDARTLSLTVRINKELTLLAPAVITITAGYIGGFTDAAGAMATLANLNVQGYTAAAAADVKVTLLADGTNLSASVLAQLSIEGEGESRALVINSSLVAYQNITMNGGDYGMVFEITDGSGSGVSVASITLAAKVANAPVYAARTATISTYYYTGAADSAFVTLATISLTNVWNTIGAGSVSIGVSEITGDDAGKYNGSLSVNYIGDPGELEIRYTRPAAPAPDDGFTVDVEVTVVSSDEDNPFTMTATVNWSHVVLPVLSLDFQSPANTVFIRGYKGTIGILTVSVASAPPGSTGLGELLPTGAPSDIINLASLPPPFDGKGKDKDGGITAHPITPPREPPRHTAPAV